MRRKASQKRPKGVSKKEWRQVRKNFSPKDEFRAGHRFARISPRKARLVADMIRGKTVQQAEQILAFSPKRGAYFFRKVLKSALANAEDKISNHRLDVDIENLYVAEVLVNEGPMMKRWLPRARGHATPIHKKMSHLWIVLRELPETKE